MMPAFFDEKLEFSLFFLFFLKSLFKTVFKCHLLPLKTHHWLFLLTAFSYVYVTQSINTASLDPPQPRHRVDLAALTCISPAWAVSPKHSSFRLFYTC